MSEQDLIQAMRESIKEPFSQEYIDISGDLLTVDCEFSISTLLDKIKKLCQNQKTK